MANLFRMSMGGGGSDIEPYIVKVTCAPSMVGKTVTMTQGSTVLSKICPSSLEVTFKPMNDGLWTVECEGSSKDVTLLAWGTYNVNISWALSTWLSTIGKTTTETSLLNYLNNEDNQADIRELMTRHVSADYLYDWYVIIPSVLDDVMASTYGSKWLGLRDYICDKFLANETAKATMLNSDNWEYILKDKVPVMTGDKTPYGECIAKDVVNTTFAKYKAFNGTNTSNIDCWHGGTIPNYLGYKFVNPICVKVVEITSRNNPGGNSTSPKDIRIEASNDGFVSDIHTLKDDITLENVQNKKTTIKIEDNNDYYLAYRVYIKNSYDNDYSAIGILQFYGRSLNVSVPKMDGNNSPYGEVLADNIDQTSGREPFRAFDKDSSTLCEGGNGCALGYDFEKPTLIKYVEYLANSGATTQYMARGVLQGSNDGLEWYNVEEFDSSKDTKIPINSTNEVYKCWRVKSLAMGSGNYNQFATLQFYGVDYSERDFAEDSKIEYIYDHGVEFANYELQGRTVLSTNHIYSFEPSCLVCEKVANSSGGAGISTVSKIDLKDFKSMRLIGQNGIDTSAYNVLGSYGTSDEDYAWGMTFDAFINVEPKDYLKTFLDLSQKEKSQYLIICSQSSNASYHRRIEITEWWLERKEVV